MLVRPFGVVRTGEGYETDVSVFLPISDLVRRIPYSLIGDLNGAIHLLGYDDWMANDLANGDWIAVSNKPLPIGEAVEWAITAKCGALTTFYGTVRDFSEGRTGVTHLDYEAYPEQVEPRLRRVAQEARDRWPMIGRIVLLHRTGRLELEEVSVFVAASTPSRPEAFAATRFLIDTLKATVPIWKKETWSEGSDWGLCDHVIADTDEGDLSFKEFEQAHEQDISELTGQQTETESAARR